MRRALGQRDQLTRSRSTRSGLRVRSRSARQRGHRARDGTANGVSALTRADLPPFGVPTRAGLRWRKFVTVRLLCAGLLAGRSLLCGALGIIVFWVQEDGTVQT